MLAGSKPQNSSVSKTIFGGVRDFTVHFPYLVKIFL